MFSAVAFFSNGREPPFLTGWFYLHSLRLRYN
nr:MAG TPA: hypothetical protein [Inoviridae sp.]